MSGAVVISGASRGLGAALARRLAAPGVALRLLARSGPDLAAVAAECAARGAEVQWAALDVRDAEGLAARLLAWDAAAPIGCVIANAGTSAGTTPEGAPEGHEAAVRQVQVNLLGAMNLVEPLLPRLVERRGQVALVASVAAFRGMPDAPGYSASKAGLWAYGQALRAAHGPAGLRVTLVAPGFFDSAMGARLVGSRPFAVSADLMAGRVVCALERGVPQLVSPWLLGAALRGLDLLPARWGDALMRLRRYRVRGE